MAGRSLAASALAVAALGLFSSWGFAQARLASPSGGVPLLGEPVAVLSGPGSGAEDRPAASRLGWSGALRARVVRALETLELPFPGAEGTRYRWTPLFSRPSSAVLGEPVLSDGRRAPAEAGIWQLEGEAEGAPTLTVITQVPLAQKKGGYLNGYFIGRYPTEGSGRRDRYAPPSGFIEVTAENQDFQISEHFRLRQFLTKDQFRVWPKYLVLDLRLIDKLELVLQELNAMGVRADRMHVMSGYRTPQYNGPGGNGRAQLSRHTYGDAADVWVDSDSDGYMDDLNGDGVSDIDDARVMQRAVDRVEQRFPELVGGAGVYMANSAHGPFIHIDTRGSRARW